ncbi:MAG TPA: hypothetical protein VNW06_02010, partial [Cytophagaceae bacterium]|nr:hypothetical protein [Cytophagaceae bacterium]
MEANMADGYSLKAIDELKENMIIDSSFRVTALENILMRKNLITEEEIQEEIKKISLAVAKTMPLKLENNSNIVDDELKSNLKLFGDSKRKVSKD